MRTASDILSSFCMNETERLFARTVFCARLLGALHFAANRLCTTRANFNLAPPSNDCRWASFSFDLPGGDIFPPELCVVNKLCCVSLTIHQLFVSFEIVLFNILFLVLNNL